MEASVDLSSPKKAPRRHYKAEFEKMCAYADELMADLGDIKRNRDSFKEAFDYAESERQRLDAEIRAANTSLRRWATAAVVKFVALIIIVVFLR